MPREAEVLWVLWHEGEVDALCAIYLNGIFQIILVESDGTTSYRADKLALQQAYVIVVDVDVREYIRQDGTHHIARAEELIYTRGVHAFDDGLLTLRRLAIDGARTCFLYRYR